MLLDIFVICDEKSVNGSIVGVLRAKDDIVNGIGDYCGVSISIDRFFALIILPSSRQRSSAVIALASSPFSLMEDSIRARDSFVSGAFATTWKGPAAVMIRTATKKQRHARK